MTAAPVELLTTDPAAGLRAVAALIRERAQAATYGGWPTARNGSDPAFADSRLNSSVWFAEEIRDAVHIASFGQPAVALAGARRIERVAHQHRPITDGDGDRHCSRCGWSEVPLDWPCPEIADAVAECTAYLTGKVPQ